MIHFHRFLIATAILFCLGFAAWAIADFRSSGGTWQLGFGIAFLLAAAVLGYYLKNLDRFLHR